LTRAKGLKHSFGFVAWADHVDTEDAVVVSALRDAGAIIYLKTTMPQTGMALETVSNLSGHTLNPFNTHLSAGGSSGGEGALNGCHGAPVGIATDIGGSVRAPASFQGLYAMRPSSKRFSYLGNQVSVGGNIAITATVGPVGRSLRDIDLISRVLGESRMWERDLAVPPLVWTPVQKVEKLVVGIMMWDGVVMPHPPILKAMETAAEKLRAAGVEG
jgi:amidase